MNEKKSMSLRKMLNLEVLSKQEQGQVTGGRAPLDNCSCPCPVVYNDISGYYDWDAAWAKQ